MIKLHQFRIDWTCKLMYLLEGTRWHEGLRWHVHRLLDKQIQRRAQAGIPVIQCSVEWGIGVADD